LVNERKDIVQKTRSSGEGDKLNWEQLAVGEIPEKRLVLERGYKLKLSQRKKISHNTKRKSRVVGRGGRMCPRNKRVGTKRQKLIRNGGLNSKDQCRKIREYCERSEEC